MQNIENIENLFRKLGNLKPSGNQSSHSGLIENLKNHSKAEQIVFLGCFIFLSTVLFCF